MNPADKFKYCPVCGNGFKKGKHKLICVKCGFEYYNNPKPCNGVILVNPKNEILLVKRKDDPKRGFWDLPGGFVDGGENIEESVVREIKEELGIEISSFKYLGSLSDNYLYQGVDWPTVGLIFKAEIRKQDFKIADDITEYKYFPLDKIPYEEIAFESVKKILQKLEA